MTSVLVYAALAVASLVTSFISGILGMAGGMILMGVLLAFLPLAAAMMLHGVCQFSANGWRAFMLAQHYKTFPAIDIRGYAIGAILALGLFALLRIVVSKPVALIAMGLTPFVALALPEKLHLNVERRGQSLTCGFICSALALTAGVSGPILDVFFVRSKMTRHKVVATKASTQSLSHVLKIAYFGGVLAVEGGAVEPVLAAIMVALAFIGTSLSRQVLERITDASFRLWTRWTVMTLGAIYLASGVVSIAR